jgi:hypothetical protein
MHPRPPSWLLDFWIDFEAVLDLRLLYEVM